MTGFTFVLQYQNVFAPLIKLEADYDKVMLVSLYLLLIFFTADMLFYLVIVLLKEDNVG